MPLAIDLNGGSRKQPISSISALLANKGGGVVDGVGVGRLAQAAL